MTDCDDAVQAIMAVLRQLGYSLDDLGDDEKKLAYGEAEAAELLSLSPRTLYSLRKQGRLKAKTVGSRVLYTNEELMRFLRDTNN